MSLVSQLCVRPGGLLAAAGFTLLGSPFVAATPLPAWEPLPPLPVGNGGFVSAALDDEIVVAGGTTWHGDTKLWLDQIWAYHPRRRTWREAGRLPAAVGYSVFGQDARALWFAGGSSGASTHRSLWQMTTAAAISRVSPIDHGAVIGFGALIGSTLYLVGGTDDPTRTDRTTNVCVGIDVGTGETRRLADHPESSVITGAAAALGDRLYVFGGGGWDAAGRTVVNRASAHVYLPAEDRWEALPPLPRPARGLAAVVLDESHILIAGGFRGPQEGFVADAMLFDPTARTYTPTVPLPYAAMVGLVRSGDWLYCLGGEDRAKHRTDAAFRIRWRDLLPPPK